MREMYEFRIALRENKIDEALTMLKEDFSLTTHCDEYQNTPLHLAAWHGHEKLAQRLVDEGASIDLSNKDGDTPLHLAARLGHKRVIQVLLMRGANYKIKDRRGDTPLILLQYTHPDLVPFFKELIKIQRKKNTTTSSEHALVGGLFYSLAQKLGFFPQHPKPPDTIESLTKKMN